MLDELDVLRDEEQSLHAQLKSLRAKQQLALEAQAEAEALASQMRHEAHMKQVAELAPVRVLGVTYESLRKYRKQTSVRFVPVHKDIRALLIAALPSASEEQFCELCTALVSKLMGYSPSHEAIEAIDALRASTDASRYFDPELYNAVVVIAFANSKNEKLSNMLTAYALAWGSATQFEGSE